MTKDEALHQLMMAVLPTVMAAQGKGASPPNEPGDDAVSTAYRWALVAMCELDRHGIYR